MHPDAFEKSEVADEVRQKRTGEVMTTDSLRFHVGLLFASHVMSHGVSNMVRGEES